MIYLLLLLLVCLTVMTFIMVNRDIFAPAFIVCAVFFFSTVCCIYNSKYWQTNLGFDTVIVIIGGCFIFTVIACLFQEIAKMKYGIANAKIKCELNKIEIQKHKVIFTILLELLLIVMQIRFVNYVVGFSSSGNLVTWSLKMEYYRNVVSYDTSGLHITLPSYISITQKLATILAYVFLYICVNNFLASKEKKWYKKFDFMYMLPVLMYILYNLVGATRGSILIIFLAGITIFHLLYHKKNGWNKRYRIKDLITFALLVVGLLALFVFLRNIVGRRYSETAADPMYYICCYAGGSIHLLDDFIKNPPSGSKIWGEETFYSLIRFLGSHLDIDDWVYVSHLEYRISNGLNVGNVYSAFRKYIYDFGYLGVVWCTALVSAIYNALYYRIKYKKKKKTNVDISILFFGYIAYGYYYMSIQEQPLSTILCLTTIMMPFLFKLAVYWLLGLRFVFYKRTTLKVVSR